MKIELAKPSVRLLSHYGSDREIAERSWVSTNKAVDRTDDDVSRVLKFIVHNRHTKPLELVHFSFFVECSIATDRQLCTHRIMDASIALSHRYTEAVPRFGLPLDLVEGSNGYCAYFRNIEKCFRNYEETLSTLLTDGFSPKRAREIARNLLPVGTLIRREFTINLLSLCNFFRLRTEEHSQLEMRNMALMMYTEVMAVQSLMEITNALDEVNWDV